MMSKWYYGGLLLALVAGLAFAFAGRDPTQLQASLVAQAAPADASGFARAEGPQPLNFPTDHGPHNDYQTEWWYFTGNVTAETGEHFGYQLTFFRRALQPPAERTTRDSNWAAEQVYLAHFALTDVAGREHHAFEKLARGAAGLAGAQAQPFRVWLDDWSVAASDGGSLSEIGAPNRLYASEGGVTLDLTLRNAKPPVLQGEDGYSRKGPEPGNASYYYSLTRMDADGTVIVDGKSYTVSGLGWMDHEFSTSALGPEQVGWDWFSLQLDDGTDLMVFQLRRADGKPDGFSSGSVVAADGSSRTLAPGEFTITPTDEWRSPHTGGVYPSGWRVTVPSAGLDLMVTPHLEDQEMLLSFTYWEGAVEVTGMANGAPVSGNGYVELTGYAGSMQGQF
jgi:predicted secreted hydrolase